jgi:hypothetical protein
MFMPHVCSASLTVVASFIAMLGLSASMAVPADNGEDNGATGQVVVPHPVFDKGRWGYIDDLGRVVITPQFDWASDFFDDRAAVAVRSPEKSGYIRPDGSWAVVLPRGAFPATGFSEGRAWFSSQNRMGCVDADGRIVIPAQYDRAGEFSEGLAVVTEGGPKWHLGLMTRGAEEKHGFVDQSGKVVIPLQYASASRFGDGLACTRRPGASSFDYINRSGKVVFSIDGLPGEPQFYVGYASGFSGGRAVVSFDGVSSVKPFASLIDRDGRLIGPQKTYEAVALVSEGLARVKIRGKIGYANIAGQLVVPATFDDGGDFHGNRCRVRIGPAWQYVDGLGKVVAKNSRGSEAAWNDAEDFHGSLARVHVGGQFQESGHAAAWWRAGRWLYIDKNGKVVSNCRDDGPSSSVQPLTLRPFGREHAARGH